MSTRVIGTSEFQEIEGGFWAIKTEEGESLRPQMMPEQFKIEGAKIECRVEYLEDDFEFQMWGTPVRIVSFKTVGT